jgi:hypothetical protein
MEPIPSRSIQSSAREDLAAELRGLKQLFYVAVFALIVMGVSLNLYRGKQMRLARAQLAEQRQATSRAAQDFHGTSEPLIRNFAIAMNAFAATNRDFEPVFNKYRGAFAKYLTGPASATPVPAAPPKN